MIGATVWRRRKLLLSDIMGGRDELLPVQDEQETATDHVFRSCTAIPRPGRRGERLHLLVGARNGT